jgi:hypothetical protein
VAGRVIREYFGTGEVAELIARRDALDRRRREEEAWLWREERERFDVLDAGAGELDDLAELLARASFLAAGYRQHERGEWRNRVSEIDQQGGMSSQERRESVAELRALVERAQGGDEEALSEIDTVIKRVPALARAFGNLNVMVEEGFIERTAADSPFRQKAVKATLEGMRQDLAGPNPSPLKKLGAEWVASCWLQLHYAELFYDQELPKLSLDQDDHHQKRLDRLHKRYLSAMRSLAQVRKLLKPKVAQINIGEKQQINTGAPLSPVADSTPIWPPGA